MDTATENQGQFRSGLRPPTKIELPTTDSPARSGLNELNDAGMNSRGAMGPPAGGSLKHKPTGLPEPATKRKTLQDIAGEQRNNKPAPTSSRPVSAAVKNATNGPRGHSASTTRLPSTSAPKPSSTSSFGGSVGYGGRAPSANGYTRPKTSQSQYNHGRSKSQYHASRPASRAEAEVERPERKGAFPLSISTNLGSRHTSLHLPKQRQVKDRAASVPAARAVSGASRRTSQSSIFTLEPTSPVLEDPVDADYEEILDGLEALTMGASATGTHGQGGRGTFSGKGDGASLNSSTSHPRVTVTSHQQPIQSIFKTPSKSRRAPSSPSKATPVFLNRFTNDHAPVFDTELRLDGFERQFNEFKEKIEKETSQANDLKETIKILQTRVTELEGVRTQLIALNEELRSDLKDAKGYMSSANVQLESVQRKHTFEVDDMRRKHRNEVDDIQDRNRKETDRLRNENEAAAEKVHKDFSTQIDKLLKMHSEELVEMEKKLKAEIEEERSRRSRETLELQTEYTLKLQNAGVEAGTKEREAQNIRGELINVQTELDREKMLRNGLQTQLTESTTLNLTLEAGNKAMKEKIDFLESDSQAQSQAFNDLHRRMQEAIEAAELAHEKLRQEETLRRKLHNQVQELKGNIRVMCRVRPTHDSETDPAKIGFPDDDTDSKEVAIQGPEKQSAMGKISSDMHAYSFDRVFSPTAQNAEVFEEISQLVQSALDGYNVCIFCYGQTGSGKTFTMSSDDGMIPRATAQIYAEAKRLEEKGWRYKMEGNFVEVYNETYNDLLGRSEDLDKKKLEVRHDTVKKQTTLENAVSVELDGPHRVEEILKTASKNRSVAATKANQRSSRSHSVFILKLVGENTVTGEKSEGTLNLVDLAGSERLDHSKAEGARLKETQNINKSLSCLGDVINALGSAKEGSHIPYRNSKLTYLLQYSLGGNSKTLMFVMVSPLQAHLQETITSLKFATKVHNTHIGTAKKQTKA